MTDASVRAAGAGAAAAWCVTAWRWFDAGVARPAWLEALPVALPAAAAAALGAVWLWARRRDVWDEDRAGTALALALAGVAVLFRLPMAMQGAAGYLTADGALSGIVALRVRDGVAHHVFVPHVPYSGSLKSHVTAVLATAIDPAVAFALASVAFYALFVVVLVALARRALVPEGDVAARRGALLAGVYAAFAPPFVTHYSLSNDGNYVEVLGLGTFALLLAARWLDEPERRPRLALVAGVALGLAFWCHILAVMHAAAVALVLVASGRRGLRSWAPLAAGSALGYAPGLLWNAGNHWQSFGYVIPGAQRVGGMERAPGVLARIHGLLADQWPVLLGYDTGYPVWLDRVVWAGAGVAVAAVAWGLLETSRELRRRRGLDGLGVVVLFAVVNQAVAFVALPPIPANPRYLLFLVAPVAIVLARGFGSGRRRVLLGALIAFSALGSLAQLPAAQRSDARWRGFVERLEAAGVRWCYTDFYLATPVNFLSQENVVCTAKLGPTTTEYFFDYRTRVESAPEAALIAVNGSAGEKLARRLDRLGVGYERLDLMKPVLRPFRKVDPAEIFPERDFGMR